jgi:hypothetical protein
MVAHGPPERLEHEAVVDQRADRSGELAEQGIVQGLFAVQLKQSRSMNWRTWSRSFCSNPNSLA